MNTCCPTVPHTDNATPVAPVQTPAKRGLFASLGKIINTASFVSVDLTDTIFATLPRRDGAPREAVVKPHPDISRR